MWIDNEYTVYYKNHCIGTYYIYENGTVSYSTSSYSFIGLENEDIPNELKTRTDDADKIPFFQEVMTEENRVQGTKKTIYKKRFITIERIPQDTGEQFYVYRRRAEKGEEGYSEKDYSAPHYEGGKNPDGMREWASWYCFNKKDDGTYEAELDEAWWWGGGHNDGGTIRVEIPEEWLSMPYDEFLENVITLASASHYGFTVQDLKEKRGLKKFFGFDEV